MNDKQQSVSPGRWLFETGRRAAELVENAAEKILSAADPAPSEQNRREPTNDAPQGDTGMVLASEELVADYRRPGKHLGEIDHLLSERRRVRRSRFRHRGYLLLATGSGVRATGATSSAPPRTHRASTGQDQDSAVTCWYG